MKIYTFLISLASVLILSHSVPAQITKLANNNNIEGGVPLGGIGIMATSNDSLWRTDGTPAGTFKYATNVAFDMLGNGAIFLGKIYNNLIKCFCFVKLIHFLLLKFSSYSLVHSRLI